MIIKNVPLKGGVAYNLAAGTEVLVIYRGGYRYQILIDEQTNAGIDSTSKMQSQYSDDTAFKALMTNHILQNIPFVIADTSLDVNMYSGYSLAGLPKSSFLRDVPATELPIHGSRHESGGDDIITPETIIGTKFGTVTLTLGLATVTTSDVTATSRIFLTGQDHNVIGTLYVSARVANTSFNITSTKLTDSGNVAWLILEPL
jgi:hypothetical protein